MNCRMSQPHFSFLALPTLGLSVVLLTTSLAADTVDLAALDGNNGFVLYGVDYRDHSGESVAGVGDVNADGYEDFVIGAPGDFLQPDAGEGEGYLVFGAPSWPAALELSTLDGTNGVRLFTLEERRTLGESVAGAGDINGDGFGDFVIGGSGSTGFPGAAYVVFGRSAWPTSLELSALDGTDGLTVLSGQLPFQSNELGVSVSGGGDINGDGLFDFVIGDTFSEDAGDTTWVVFGAESYPPTLELDELNGENGFAIVGNDELAGAASTVAHAGDLNGDTFDDIVISTAPFFPSDTRTYVIFGRPTFEPKIVLANLYPTQGFSIVGSTGSTEGESVASAGDVNRDGFDDLVLSTEVGGGILFGRPDFPSTVDVSSFDGEKGALLDVLEPLMSDSIESLASLHDFNLDGFDDLVLARTLFGSHVEGYVVYGRRSFPASLNLRDLKGAAGFVYDTATIGDGDGRAAGAGDINRDGFDDLLVGNPYGDPPTAELAGKTYVVFGDSSPTITFAIEGSCPGTATLSVSGFTPNGNAGIWKGSGMGSSRIATGPCGGLELDLEDAGFLTLLAVDGNGEVELSKELPKAACGEHLQVVDARHCLMTEVVQLPE